MIDARAVIDPAARLGPNVRIGPFCIVGPDVTLGEGVVLHSHAVVTGRTTIDAGTSVFPFAVIGHRPQDMKYAGEASTVAIGRGCTIREGVTVHSGTEAGGGATAVGDRCTLLAGAHVAHDCRLGDDVVLSNNVMLAGHVTIGDGAILGGGVGVHQFVRIGEMAFVGGLSGLEGDLVPFGLALGNRARLAGLNLVGLRRQGVSANSIDAIRGACETVFATGDTLTERLERGRRCFGHDPFAAKLLAFVGERGRRPLCGYAVPAGQGA